MSDSYKDIDGPITVLVTYTVKPEYVNEFAQWLLAWKGEYPTRALSSEIVRHENVFVCWEKFIGFHMIEETALITFVNARDNIVKWTAKEPDFKFFATNSVLAA